MKIIELGKRYTVKALISPTNFKKLETDENGNQTIEKAKHNLLSQKYNYVIMDGYIFLLNIHLIDLDEALTIINL